MTDNTALENEYLAREQQILSTIIATNAGRSGAADRNLDAYLDALTQLQATYGKQLFHNRNASKCLLKVVSPEEHVIPHQYFWIHEGFLALASGLFREIFYKMRTQGLTIAGDLSTAMASVFWYPSLEVPVTGTNELIKLPTLTISVPDPQSFAEVLYFIYRGDVRRLLNFVRRENGLAILNNLQFLELDSRLVDLVVAKIEELKATEKKHK